MQTAMQLLLAVYSQFLSLQSCCFCDIGYINHSCTQDGLSTSLWRCDSMALQIQRQQMLSVPAAEKGLGPAAASLAEARVPWMCAGGPGIKPVPAQASRVTINTWHMQADMCGLNRTHSSCGSHRIVM